MANFFQLTIDCPEPEMLVACWFQAVPEAKSVTNRLHLDLRVSQGREVSRADRRSDIEKTMAEVRAAGGSFISWLEDEAADHVGAVMADPEGNEFCLV